MGGFSKKISGCSLLGACEQPRSNLKSWKRSYGLKPAIIIGFNLININRECLKSSRPQLSPFANEAARSFILRLSILADSPYHLDHRAAIFNADD
jgi:hypothetical protein